MLDNGLAPSDPTIHTLHEDVQRQSEVDLAIGYSGWSRP
jgi:hypothetical protein